MTAGLCGYIGGHWSLLGVMLFVSFFEIGLGPVPWLIVGEMIEPRYCSTCQMYVCMINWLANIVVGLGFPFINEVLGTYSFVPFGIVLLLTLIYVCLELPETYGLTPSEVLESVRDPEEEPLRVWMQKAGGMSTGSESGGHQYGMAV